MLDSKVVIGIDFGTTYSGVSWALNRGQRNIRLITDWPDPTATNTNADKVPTIISYKNGQVDRWGYEVGLKDDAFRWFKILLQPDYLDNKMTAEVYKSDELLRKLGKSAQEVVSDYLGQLWEYTREHIRKRVGVNDWENNHDIDIVLTVPAMWSHTAKDRTLKAAREAGLPENAKIGLVTEPEAAALATLREQSEENTLQEGDVFVVCDAGGGTVDLISYRVKNTHPLRVEECAVPEGDLCGSVFLDTAFENYIQTLVGEEQYKGFRTIDKKKMLHTFEHGVKRCFSVEPTQRLKHYSVELRGVEDNEAEGIIEEEISLKPSMLKTLFDHVCGHVVTLVHNQVSEVKSQNLKVKSILLVGGFGASKYLHHRLEMSYRLENISILQVEGAWSSICRGACMWGLENADRPDLRPSCSSSSTRVGVESTVSSRISQYSYGVIVTEPFDPKRHDLKDRIVSESDGEYRANNQMRWLLRRGERVVEGRILAIDVDYLVHGVGFWSLFHSRNDKTIEAVLYSCKETDPPSRYDHTTVMKLCQVKFTIPAKRIIMQKSFKGTVKRGKWRKLDVEFLVRLGNANLRYFARYHGDEYGTVEATYVE